MQTDVEKGVRELAFGPSGVEAEPACPVPESPASPIFLHRSPQRVPRSARCPRDRFKKLSAERTMEEN